MVDRINDFTW